MGIIHALYGKFDNRCLQSADSRPWFLRTRTWAIRGTLGVHPICTNSSLAVSLFGVTWTCDDQHVCPSLDLSLQVTGWCVVLFPSWSLSEVDFFLACLVQSGETPPERSIVEEGSLFRQVMTSREAHILAFFIIAHLGVGVTIGGNCCSFGRAGLAKHVLQQAGL